MTFEFKGPVAWCDELYRALERTMTHELGTARLIKEVKSGKRQAWLVKINGRAKGCLVTETLTHADGTREFFIWCYEGARAINLVQAVAVHALSGGCEAVGFYTHHRAALRGFKRFSPVVSLTGIPGEMRFSFDVRRLVNG